MPTAKCAKDVIRQFYENKFIFEIIYFFDMFIFIRSWEEKNSLKLDNTKTVC